MVECGGVSGLLAELKAERAKCFRVGNEKHGFVCDGCGIDWPCPLSRALDGMIAGVLGVQELKDHADGGGYNYNYGDLASEAADTLAAAARAYHGGRDGEEE